MRAAASSSESRSSAGFRSVLFCVLRGLLFVPLLLPRISYAQYGPTSDDQRLQQASAAMNTGDLAQAEPLLRNLRARHPHRFEINEMSGLLYAAQGKFAQAVPLMETAVRARPGSDIAHANLGAAYLKLGHTADAARELETAARLNPSSTSTQEMLGQAWMLLKQPRKAAAAFTIALSVDGSKPDLLYNTALAFYDFGDAKQAEPLLARMPGLETFAEAQSLYGDLEEKLSHYQQAAQHYVNAAKLAPTETNIYVLGSEFLRHWTFDAAIQEFQVGTRQYPDSQRMRLGLGIAYYGAVSYQKAIPVFAALLKENPGSSLYAELLGRSCIVLTEGSNAACSGLNDYAKRHPDDALLNTYAATMILHLGDDARLQLARSFLENAIKADPQLPEAMYGMGLLLQRESQWPQSIPVLEKAVRVKPDYAAAHYRLALAYSHRGDREKAQSEITLERKYSHQEQDDLENRLKLVTTLLVSMR
jgi:tetratricopeptide (TPR) repeat protein